MRAFEREMEERENLGAPGSRGRTLFLEFLVPAFASDGTSFPGKETLA